LQKSAIFTTHMKKKKIILFHPATQHEKFYSFFWIPYSVLTIGSCLSEDYTVIIIDENIDKNYSLTDEILQNVLCVGISSMIGAQIKNGLLFAQKVKNINSKIPIIWGGHLPSILPNITLESEYVDLIVLGQGEYTIIEIIKSLSKKIELKTISGIGYKLPDGKIKINPKNNSERFELPYFQWQLIDIDKYIRKDNNLGNRILNYVSSLGCPFPCTFCAEKPMYGDKCYQYNLTRIYSDIDFLISHGQLDAIKFYDANFFAYPKNAFKIIEYIKSNHSNINWAASGHPKTLNSFNFTHWKFLEESNCKRLLIGAESGSKASLNIIKKQITPQDTIQLAQKCSSFNIIGSFTFIIGFPGCNFQEELVNTLALGEDIRRIDSRHEVKIHFYAPYPGTYLYNEAKSYGFIEPRSLEEWSDYDYYNIETPWIDKKFEKEVHNFNNNNCKYVHL